MARPLRIEFEGAVYHVTARGNERKNIFFLKTDYKKFLDYLTEIKKKFKIIVGEFLGGLTCSAVAKIYRKVIQEMRGDKKLRRIILHFPFSFLNRRIDKNNKFVQNMICSLIAELTICK